MDRITKYLIILAFIMGCNAEKPVACVKGDVAGDGTIGAFDASLALDISLGNMEPTEKQLCAADFNSDGVIDDSDIEAIFEYAMNN